MQNETEKKSKLNNYVLGRTLGSGLNCKVRLGVDENTGTKYAVKLAKMGRSADANCIAMLNENNLLSQLAHPNIIRVHDISQNGRKLKPDGTVKEGIFYAVLELAENGEIFEYLANCGKFPEPIARFYFKQLMSALQFMNEKGYCHRDLKPENIFLDKDFNLKLADFGFATALGGKSGTGKLKTILGTDSYMAPELAIESERDPRMRNQQKAYNGIPVDLFSAGVILFIFITGAPCIKKAHPSDIYYKKICTNKHKDFWKTHMMKKQMKFSTDWIDLMNSLLAFDPTNRPSIAEIMSSKWMQGETATHEQVVAYFTDRKLIVDAALQRQQEEKERERRRNNMNQQRGGYAFNPTHAHRGIEEDRAVLDEKFSALVKEMRDVVLKDDFAMENREGETPKQTTVISGLDRENFAYGTIRACEEMGWKCDYNWQKKKVKATVPVTEGTVDITMKWYEMGKVNCFEFTKAAGAFDDYHEVIKKFHTEFDKLSEAPTPQVTAE